jgi:hypothetical protein
VPSASRSSRAVSFGPAPPPSIKQATALDLAIRLARVVHRCQMLAPVLEPADRAADMPRRERESGSPRDRTRREHQSRRPHRFRSGRPGAATGPASPSRPLRPRRRSIYGARRSRDFTAKSPLARRNGSRCRCNDEPVAQAACGPRRLRDRRSDPHPQPRLHPRRRWRRPRPRVELLHNLRPGQPRSNRPQPGLA